jgi:ankyrin repeat protein
MQGKTPLYIAVQEKRTDIIPLLLSYGSEIFAAENSGVTPFDLSIKDNADIFNLLVTAETVNQRDSAGNTMLHAAVRNRGIPRHIGIILDQKVSIDARNRAGDTALHIAVRMNQRENGEFLISRGANIFTLNAAGISPLYLTLTSSTGIREWMLNPSTITAKDGLGNNMLHYAAQWKLNDAIPLIIKKGVSVEEANATGETPLFMAVKTDSPSTIKTLLDNKANLNARDKQGNTLLHMAVRWNAGNSAALLISSGIDINAHSLNGGTALHDAVVLGMGDIETLLIKERANLEDRDIDGNTPFMEAVRAGLIPSIEKLASNGADTSTRNIRGDTPIHIAVSAERYDIVNMLLRMGVSIHARNTRNITPFQISLGISPRMVSTLLTRERINVPDDMGNSALHIALREKAAAGAIKVIINQGARINSVDNNGQTPLRLAVDTEQLEAVKILADAGADPFMAAVDNKSPADIAFVKGEDCIRALFSGKAINAKDSSANTILHLAARFGTPQTIETLLELGANKTIRNIASEIPADIALRWNRTENADLLR